MKALITAGRIWLTASTEHREEYIKSGREMEFPQDEGSHQVGYVYIQPGAPPTIFM
jgi:hypothetical protein